MTGPLLARFAPHIIPSPDAIQASQSVLHGHIQRAMDKIADLRERLRDSSGKRSNGLEHEQQKLEKMREEYDKERVRDFQTSIVIENPTGRSGKLVVKLWELDSFLDTRSDGPDYSQDQGHATVTAQASGTRVQEGTGDRFSGNPQQGTSDDFLAAFHGQLDKDGFACQDVVLPEGAQKGKRAPRLMVRVAGRSEPYPVYVQRDELEQEGRYFELGLELELDGQIVYSTKGASDQAPAFVDLEHWSAYDRVVRRGLEAARKEARESASLETVKPGDIVVRLTPNIIPSPAQIDAKAEERRERIDELGEDIADLREQAWELAARCQEERDSERQETLRERAHQVAEQIDAKLWQQRRQCASLADSLLDKFNAGLVIDNRKKLAGPLHIKLYELDTFKDDRQQGGAEGLVKEGGRDDFLAVFRGQLSADGSFCCEEFQLAREEDPESSVPGAPRLRIKLPGDPKRYELRLQSDAGEQEGAFLELGLTAELGTKLAYSTLANSGLAPAFVDLRAWSRFDSYAREQIEQARTKRTAPIEDDETDIRALPNPGEINNRSLRLITLSRPQSTGAFRYQPAGLDEAKQADFSAEMQSAADYAVADLLGKFYPRYNPGALRKRIHAEHRMLGLSATNYPGGGRMYLRDVFNSFYLILHTSVDDIWTIEQQGKTFVHAKVSIRRMCVTREGPGEARWAHGGTGEVLPRGSCPPDLADAEWSMIDAGNLYEPFSGQSFVPLARAHQPAVDGSTELGILAAREDPCYAPIWARRAVEKASLEAVNKLVREQLCTIALPDMLKIRGLGLQDDDGAADIPPAGTYSNPALRLMEILDKDSAQDLRYLPSSEGSTRGELLAELHGLVHASIADKLGQHYARYDFGALMRVKVVESQIFSQRLDAHAQGTEGFFRDVANQAHIILGYGIKDIWTEERDGDRYLHAAVYLRRVCMTRFEPEKVRLIDATSGNVTKDWADCSTLVSQAGDQYEEFQGQSSVRLAPEARIAIEGRTVKGYLPDWKDAEGNSQTMALKAALLRASNDAVKNVLAELGKIVWPQQLKLG